MSPDLLPATSEAEILRSEVATLQQLLEVLEHTALEQSRKLERALEERGVAAAELSRQLEVNRFLAEAGAALVSSLDYARTLREVARMSIPSFADWSFVHITDFNGTLRRVAVAHSDPEKEKLAAAVEDSHPVSEEDPFGPARVARTGQSELIEELSEDILRENAKNHSHLQQLRTFGFTSYLSVPLKARSRTQGAITFAMAESQRHYGQSDLVLAEQLAHRATLAIDNARLFEEVEEARVELEERVLARTLQLEEANRELESFSYSVSHDLRAPIRHISGFADLLRKRMAEQSDPTVTHYVEAITNSARHAGNLVDDLLAFSRMGRSEMARQPVSMDTLVKQVRNDLEIETRGRTIEWRIEPVGDVVGDPAMLRLVWRNLMSNAVKYTRNQERATIAITRQDTEKDAIFEVRDNGVGFDMKYVDKLFGVFQRLHSGDVFEGTGIGLANVRRIILRHGGRTWATGEVGEGAAFLFSLPKSN